MKLDLSDNDWTDHAPTLFSRHDPIGDPVPNGLANGQLAATLRELKVHRPIAHTSTQSCTNAAAVPQKQQHAHTLSPRADAGAGDVHR